MEFADRATKFRFFLTLKIFFRFNLLSLIEKNFNELN